MKEITVKKRETLGPILVRSGYLSKNGRKEERQEGEEEREREP